MSAEVDVVVVGGGFAGVTAARELAATGASTVLIEARDRLGGRTWTTTFQGSSVEMGGGWIHWHQPHVWSEITRHAIGIKEDDASYDVVIGGEPTSEHEAASAFLEIERANARLFGDDRAALPRPHEPLFDAAAAQALDELSIADRVDGLSAEEQSWLTGLLYIVAGAPLDRGGYLQYARWLALCGWTVGGIYDNARYHPAGGTRQILEAMTDGWPVSVRTGDPVVAVSLEADRFRVECASGSTTVAKACVIATPVNLWSHIRFDPPLPPAHRALATAGAGKPQQDKVWIHAEGESRRVFGQLAGTVPLSWFFSYAFQPDGSQLIVAFNADPEFDVSDHELVASTMRSYVPAITAVRAVHSQSWGTDPYSRGGNTCYAPGVSSRHLGQVQEPVGRLAFAGADIALGWTGYIDGAIESGLRASRAVRLALAKEA